MMVEPRGATWSAPEPSPFYGTVTDPTIGRLQDGRLLFLWNNTLPLPEFPKNDFTAPFIPQSAADGTGEDFFTNRDALHAAISDDDGKTWKGFREVLLNSRRNDSNYGETRGMDRSVHQPQFVQVEAGRVLVSTGQHWLHRSLFIFDPNWLLETKRSSDFSNGLDDWSVHGYLKGIRGHCALNRYESSALVPHPDKSGSRVLQVANTGLTKAIFPRGGATWNFPMAPAGVVETRLQLSPGFGGARISLLDRWVNPTDPSTPTLAMCHLDIAADGSTNTGTKLAAGQWHTIALRWSGTAKDSRCEVLLDGKPAGEPLAFQRPANHGISYIHYQSTAEAADKGLLIESVSAGAANQ